MTLSTIVERLRGSCSCTSPFWRKPGVWIALGAVILVGLTANLNWFTAAGAVRFLIGSLPCLAMCAVHLNSKHKQAETGDFASPEATHSVG
jgi:hypothetical protein